MPSPKIHVMHTVLNLGFAGLERVVTELSLKTDRDLYNVEVCCFHRKGYFADLLEAAGITVHVVPQRQSGVDFGYFRTLARFFRERRVQVVHTHTGTFIFGAVAGKLARVPAIVYTDHGRFLVEPRIRLIEDYISSRLADRSVAVSEELRDYLIDRVRFPAKKVTTVLNGINTDTFAPRPKPPSLLAEFGLTEDTPVLGSVASFNVVKDHLTMLESFRLVLEGTPDAVLILVGDGPLRETIEAFIAQHELGGKVFLTGKRKDVPELLDLFDLFLLSSLSEGTSMSIAEAMSSGLPCVVTDVGGNPSIVDDGENGILVPTKNPRKMADAIASLLEDTEKRRRFSAAAVDKVKRAYSAEVMAAEYSELYLEILRRKGRLK